MHYHKFLCIMQLFSQHNIYPYLINVIHATILSCITHQLNIIKCITKQYHEMTIEYLYFIHFMGRLLLESSASSSSLFIISSFLIQMLRWIRGSSRLDVFIFLIAWGIFFEWWEIDLQLLPYSSSLLMSEAYSSSQSQLKVITSFW